MIDFAKLRQDYSLQSLDESSVLADPFRQFEIWLQEAVRSNLREPNAMTLATATPDGVPSARIVLLKHLDADGFVFFTNYRSQKGRDLAVNPRAALLFYWAELERQVRIEGAIAPTSPEESDAYFRTRPFSARVAAVASAQSQPLPARAELEIRMAELQAAHDEQTLSRPSHWGGYRLRPERFEFWQGRPSRVHDRIEYCQPAGGLWRIRRLSP